MTNHVINFGGNQEFAPTHAYVPESEAEVLDILRRHRGANVRVMGRLHSWSAAVGGGEVLLDLRKLNRVVIDENEAGPRVVLGGGCQIKRALRLLDRRGLTLPTMGLIAEQSIAGACATATHGSGRHSLSHYIEVMRIAHYDAQTGEPTVSEIRAGDALRAARCSLGCLGVVLSIELRPRPAYRVREWFAMHETLESVLAAEAECPLQQFYYLPWFDKFLAQHRQETTAARSWLAPLYRAYWFSTIDLGLHLILRFLTQRLKSSAAIKAFFRHAATRTVIRQWRVVDRSQDMLLMRHELFRHIEIEIFVRRSQLAAAVDFARRLIIECDGAAPGFDEAMRARLIALGLSEPLRQAAGSYTHHYPVCARRVMPDDAMLAASAGGDEDFYALSFISYALPNERDGFYRFAEILAHAGAALFDARCHWGKVCPLTANEIARLYPERDAFRAVCSEFDAQGAFQNAWLRETIFAD